MQILLFFLIVQATPEDPGSLMKNIWSPYCKGVSLLECPSSHAEKLRTEIWDRTAQGESTEVIWNDLQSRYGDQLRMQPNIGGRESLAYWIPYFAFFMLSMFAMIWWSKRRRVIPKVTSTTSTPPTINAKLLQDLKDQNP